MVMAEDAASVLEQFVQDVANLPAEIAHLLEEIHAKDRVVQECRGIIANRDNNIQKFIKANGAGQPNPKDDAYSKVILANFDRAQIVQEEKVGLGEKAALLLDRQIKRLDFKIRDLQNEGAIQPDPQLPSLLNNTSLSTRLPPLSTTTTGTNTPLHPLSGNAGPSTTIANAPIARLVQPASQRQPSPLTSLPSNPIARTSARSPSTDPSKRRRLNPLPPTSSSLRQSSLGPGTPKTHNDGPSRGSSAGPRPLKKGTSSRPTAPHQRINHLNPTAAAKKPTPSSISSRRRAGNKPNKSSTPASNDPSESAEDAEMEDAEGEEEEEEGQDDRKYCTCRSVSYGNMVGCDNEECPYEWFHWSCVGLKSEPPGKWFCPECRAKTREGRVWVEG